MNEKKDTVTCNECNSYDYDNTFVSDDKSRNYLKIAAAYVNVATRARLDYDEFKKCKDDSINEVKARAFAVMTNLAFASEVALKGKLFDEKFSEIPRNEGHNLKVLFNNLPKCEQEQIKMIMQKILLLDEETFDDYMEICKKGFVEWRYFFEEDKKGKTYDYLGITYFLYTLAYCLIIGEGTAEILEPSEYKKQCYIGQWGFYKEKKKIEEEYGKARLLALKEGGGMITPEDEEWLSSIKNRLEEVKADIKRTEKDYYLKNT